MAVAMAVRTLMSAPAHACQPETNLAAVTQMMWDHDCGLIPVVDTAGHVVGVVTDRDVCVATGTRRVLPERIAAGEVMSRSVHSVLPEDPIEQAMTVMREAKVHRVPVIDAAGHLQGVLSMSDIVRAAGKKGAPAAQAVVAVMAAVASPRPIALAVA